MAQLDVMVALVVVAAVVPWSSAVLVAPNDDECSKGCAKYEKTEPLKLAQCKDECALEADFKAATEGLEECNKACEAKGGSPAEVGVCMEACTMKVDAAVGVAATRACYRDCSRDTSKGDAAALKKCEALCDATGEKGAAATEEAGETTAGGAVPKRR